MNDELSPHPLAEQLLETLQISDRIILYVLDHISMEQLGARPQKTGRTVGEMMAHIHNTRLLWLDAAAPDLRAGQTKLSKEDALVKETLAQALAASAEAVAVLVQRSIVSGGRVKGFKPHTPAFIGYLIAQTFYHLGEIGIWLAQSGFPLDKKVSYGLWEWGVR